MYEVYSLMFMSGLQGDDFGNRDRAVSGFFHVAKDYFFKS